MSFSTKEMNASISSLMSSSLHVTLPNSSCSSNHSRHRLQVEIRSSEIFSSIIAPNMLHILSRFLVRASSSIRLIPVPRMSAIISQLETIPSIFLTQSAMGDRNFLRSLAFSSFRTLAILLMDARSSLRCLMFSVVTSQSQDLRTSPTAPETSSLLKSSELGSASSTL